MFAFLFAGRRQRMRVAYITLVLVLTAGIGYVIHRTPPRYDENATVLFTMRGPQSAANGYAQPSTAMITYGAEVCQIVMDPQTAARVKAAGGTAPYDLSLINFFNQDYPRYDFPEATLSTSAASPLAAHRTFDAVARILDEVLAAGQASQGVGQRDRVVARLAGDSGVVAAEGSRKRAAGGFLLLAAVLGTAGLRAFGRWWPGDARRRADA